LYHTKKAKKGISLSREQVFIKEIPEHKILVLSTDLLVSQIVLHELS